MWSMVRNAELEADRWPSSLENGVPVWSLKRSIGGVGVVYDKQ